MRSCNALVRETNGGSLAEHKVMHFERQLVEGRPKMRMAGLAVLLIGGLGLAGCAAQTASVACGSEEHCRNRGAESELHPRH